jgi:signal transduction histidine kinase
VSPRRAAATSTGRRGIFARQGILVAVGVFFPAAVALVIGWGSLRDIEEELLSQHVLLARSLAANAGDHLKVRLEPFLSVTALNASDPAGADRDRFTSALRGAWKETRLLSGGFLLSPGGALLWEDPPGALRALPTAGLASAAAAVSGGRVAVTDALKDGSGREVVLVLAPVRGEGGAVSCVAGGLILPGRLPFTLLMDGAAFEEGGSADLVDGSGTVLDSSDDARVLKPSGHAATVRRLAGGGTAAARLSEGREPASGAGASERELLAWAPVPNTPWGLLVRQPEREALAAVRGMTKPLMWLVPAGTVLGLALAWGAARSLLQPLKRLNEAAEEITRGNLARPIPPLPDDEVGRLGRSLEAMRVALNSSLNEVHRANEALEARVADRTQKLVRLYKELQDREEARGKLLQKVIRAQEEERKRLARELHDETCQTVAALRMGLETARDVAPDDAARARLADLEALSRRTLEDLHRLIFDLRPSVLDDLGLLPALRWLGTKNLVPRGISVRYEFEGEDAGRLPPPVETALFRAAQEALTNIVRHSGAETVLVQASIGPVEARVEIEDDGKGFEPASVSEPQESGRGLGLLGMRERLDLFGGRIQIESSPGQGTRVVLTVPLSGGAALGKGA